MAKIIDVFSAPYMGRGGSIHQLINSVTEPSMLLKNPILVSKNHHCSDDSEEFFFLPCVRVHPARIFMVFFNMTSRVRWASLSKINSGSGITNDSFFSATFSMDYSVCSIFERVLK